MKPKIKIAISLSVVLACAAIATTTGVLLSATTKKKKDESCTPECADQLCGRTCVGESPSCTGTRCEDPAATCENGLCLKQHSCSPEGACVLDPNGIYRGDTCKCFDVFASGETGEEVCELVGDGGVFKTETSCQARNADFQCVPGTGTCERVLGASTGWRFDTDCACFECPQDTLACVPTQSINPGEAGIDAEACDDCGTWKCDGGACVQVRNGEGGVWEESADCACGACVDGACAASEGGGIYTTVAACETDGGAMCTNPNLGWACSVDAGNGQACEQVIGGTAATLEDCRCWTCAGTPPGPTSGCVVDYSNAGEYPSFDDCLLDEDRMCGWKYECGYAP